MLTRIALSCALGLSCCCGSAAIAADKPQATDPLAATYLESGKLADGEAALQKRLAAEKGDDQARYGLAMIQFLQGLERLSQSLHKHDLNSEAGALAGIPVLRLPVPPNENPQEISYDDTRQILQTWVNDLVRVEATLAEIRDENIQLPLRLGRVRLDVNGDGQAADDETFWQLFATVARLGNVDPNEADIEVPELVIGFDRGDVHWMRGYCHLLAGVSEIALAYDSQELFERTAHLFFPRVNTPHAYLQTGPKLFDLGSGPDIMDLIAFIHLLNFEVKEPDRMTTALKHFESMVDQSFESWKFIEAEEDSHYEWVPNPSQASVLPNVRVTQEMIDAWKMVMTDVKAVLAGEKLIPFWRDNGALGVNVRRVFTEPQRFDLVLWVQGTGATPYLEEGNMIDTTDWARINNAFRGQFFFFAIWFN